MERAILSLITAFAISYLIFPPAIRAFHNFSLVDNPGGRKIHKESIPALGGIPLFVGVIISLAVWLPIGVIANFKFYIVAVAFMFLVGLRDDIQPISALQKLICQIAAASLLFYLCDIRIESFHGLFGLWEMPIWLSYLATVFTVIVIANAYNLIDGIDGFAGSVGLITLLFYGGWFLMVGQTHFSYIAFAFSGAIIAFLIFNWHPAKIFLGDSGTSVIGILIASYTVFFIDVNSGLPKDHTFRFLADVGAPVGFLILPLADTARVFIKRTLAGKSFMTPDNSHIHHIVLSLGYNHGQATIVLIMVKVFFLTIVFSLRRFPDKILLPIIVGMAIAFSLLLNWAYRQHKKKKMNQKDGGTKQVFINKSA